MVVTEAVLKVPLEPGEVVKSAEDGDSAWGGVLMSEKWEKLKTAFEEFLEEEPDVEYVVWCLQMEHEEGTSELSQ